jgi:hypothetical protein
MGLGAFVHCRCFQRGLTSPPPVPARYDEADGSVVPTVPTTDEEILAFDRWMYSACPHDAMEAAHEHIGNWAACSAFRRAIELLGTDRLPTLARELPTANGGRTSPTDAIRILAELDRFDESRVGWNRPVLVDRDTGAVVNERVEAYDGVVRWNGRDRTDAGIDIEGRFFVRERDTAQVRFLATEFTQHELDGSADPELRPVVLEAPDGQRLTITGALRRDAGDPCPQRLQVELRPVDPGTFTYTVNALRRIMTVAERTGMPVDWV